MRKEYMGEVAIPLLEWFDGGNVALWSDNLPVSPLLKQALVDILNCC
jgi:hypothetical protein